MSTAVDSSWARVGAVPPTALVDARLQLHHAAQIAVSAAISYLPRVADDSHTSLAWVVPVRALVTELILADRPFRIAVRPEDLSLHSLDGALNAGKSFALPGTTVAEAHEWVAEVANAAGLDASRLTARKHYTIPPHAVEAGAPFSMRGEVEFAELERYLSNAAHLLEAVARETPGASPIRVWPHHFDIATLITLPADATGARRTIGVGQSPGDEWYDEPYWYVGPYPYPHTADLPDLDGGHWHTRGWVGAVLTASDYVEAEAPEQRRRVEAFVGSAVRACRRLLGMTESG